ncbi:fibronectin type III domain-containing protein [Tetraselmis virus 1]|uniref:Fibronectin type III domain-containing protein n=1 Tax=Tetraselmis virus 1 TaxID=2060617 RepID=A0A2P0VP87_9VIRU|nr:fibronectin type III domain-containing protein [Tetraselmis virus 1]AUF82589.1 fibronectin type III domain-containing protein [Tetraselmis virus 1]
MSRVVPTSFSVLDYDTNDPRIINKADPSRLYDVVDDPFTMSWVFPQKMKYVRYSVTLPTSCTSVRVFPVTFLVDGKPGYLYSPVVKVNNVEMQKPLDYDYKETFIELSGTITIEISRGIRLPGQEDKFLIWLESIQFFTGTIAPSVNTALMALGTPPSSTITFSFSAGSEVQVASTFLLLRQSSVKPTKTDMINFGDRLDGNITSVNKTDLPDGKVYYGWIMIQDVNGQNGTITSFNPPSLETVDVTPPTITDPVMVLGNDPGHEIDVSFGITDNKAAQTTYILISTDLSPGGPSASIIKSTGDSIPGSQTTFTKSGLNEVTQYSAWMLSLDAAGNETSPIRISPDIIFTDDVTNPVINSTTTALGTDTSSQIDFTFDVSDNYDLSKVYTYFNNVAVEPTPNYMKTNGDVYDVTGTNDTASYTKDGLPDGFTYYPFIMVEDSYGNFSEVEGMGLSPLTTLDVTPPEIQSATIRLGDNPTSSIRADYFVTDNVPVTFDVWTLIKQDNTTPNVTEMKNNGSQTTSAIAFILTSGLDPGTRYYSWVYAEDGTGNGTAVTPTTPSYIDTIADVNRPVINSATMTAGSNPASQISMSYDVQDETSLVNIFILVKDSSTTPTASEMRTGDLRSPGSTSFVKSGLSRYTTYYAWIMGDDSSGNDSIITPFSPPSILTEDDTPPVIATFQPVAPDTNPTTSIKFNYNVTSESPLSAVYIFYRPENTIPSTEQVKNDGDSVTATANQPMEYTASSLVSGETYYCWIVASDIYNNETFVISSTPSSYTVDDIVNPVVDSASMTLGMETSSEIDVTFTVSDNFDVDQVYILCRTSSATPNSSEMLTGDSVAGSSTSFTKTGLFSLTTYYVWIMAVDFAGNQSTILSVSPGTLTTEEPPITAFKSYLYGTPVTEDTPLVGQQNTFYDDKNKYYYTTDISNYFTGTIPNLAPEVVVVIFYGRLPTGSNTANMNCQFNMADTTQYNNNLNFNASLTFGLVRVINPKPGYVVGGPAEDVYNDRNFFAPEDGFCAHVIRYTNDGFVYQGYTKDGARIWNYGGTFDSTYARKTLDDYVSIQIQKDNSCIRQIYITYGFDASNDDIQYSIQTWPGTERSNVTFPDFELVPKPIYEVATMAGPYTPQTISDWAAGIGGAVNTAIQSGNATIRFYIGNLVNGSPSAAIYNANFPTDYLQRYDDIWPNGYTTDDVFTIVIKGGVVQVYTRRSRVLRTVSGTGTINDTVLFGGNIFNGDSGDDYPLQDQLVNFAVYDKPVLPKTYFSEATPPTVTATSIELGNNRGEHIDCTFSASDNYALTSIYLYFSLFSDTPTATEMRSGTSVSGDSTFYTKKGLNPVARYYVWIMAEDQMGNVSDIVTFGDIVTEQSTILPFKSFINGTPNAIITGSSPNIYYDNTNKFFRASSTSLYLRATNLPIFSSRVTLISFHTRIRTDTNTGNINSHSGMALASDDNINFNASSTFNNVTVTNPGNTVVYTGRDGFLPTDGYSAFVVSYNSSAFKFRGFDKDANRIWFYDNSIDDRAEEDSFDLQIDNNVSVVRQYYAFYGFDATDDDITHSINTWPGYQLSNVTFPDFELLPVPTYTVETMTAPYTPQTIHDWAQGIGGSVYSNILSGNCTIRFYIGTLTNGTPSRALYNAAFPTTYSWRFNNGSDLWNDPYATDDVITLLIEDGTVTYHHRRGVTLNNFAGAGTIYNTVLFGGDIFNGNSGDDYPMQDEIKHFSVYNRAIHPYEYLMDDEVPTIDSATAVLGSAASSDIDMSFTASDNWKVENIYLLATTSSSTPTVSEMKSGDVVSDEITSHTITSLVSSTTYYLWIMADDASGNNSIITAFSPPTLTTQSEPIVSYKTQDFGTGGTLDPSNSAVVYDNVNKYYTSTGNYYISASSISKPANNVTFIYFTGRATTSTSGNQNVTVSTTNETPNSNNLTYNASSVFNLVRVSSPRPGYVSPGTEDIYNDRTKFNPDNAFAAHVVVYRPSSFNFYGYDTNAIQLWDYGDGFVLERSTSDSFSVQIDANSLIRQAYIFYGTIPTEAGIQHSIATWPGTDKSVTVFPDFELLPEPIHFEASKTAPYTPQTIEDWAAGIGGAVNTAIQSGNATIRFYIGTLTNGTPSRVLFNINFSSDYLWRFNNGSDLWPNPYATNDVITVVIQDGVVTAYSRRENTLFNVTGAGTISDTVLFGANILNGNSGDDYPMQDEILNFSVYDTPVLPYTFN